MLSDIKLKSKKLELVSGMTLRVIPSKEMIPFPGMIIPISADSLNLTRILEDAHSNEADILLLAKKNKSSSDLTHDSYYEVGCVGRIIQILKLPGLGVKAVVQPLERAKVKNFSVSNDSLLATIDPITIDDTLTEYVRASFRIVKRIFKEYMEISTRKLGAQNDDYLQALRVNKSVLDSVDMIISNLNVSDEKKQELLEETNMQELLSKLHVLLIHEMEFSKLEKRIESDVSEKIMKEQKDYFLKEKLKEINSELRGDYNDISEIEKINKLINNDLLTKGAKEKAFAEIEKLKRLHTMSPEYGLIRDYLDMIANLPWKKSTKARININTAEKILDEDHFGLEKPKERILEYLSVLKLVKKIKGPILCLVGPPGVGKTSLGKSIARAMKREYIRMALGGLHDESEVRGHRRTYIGAMPGKIIQQIKKAEVNNPLFLLDEIDKISNSFRGDPSSALLEVLDPEQNNTFMDNYLDIEFDLSNVLFIATANDKFKIPKPLYDRMEIIEIDGYLDVEKFHIAQDYLIKKQKKENGIKKNNLIIEDEAIYKIISDYTMEAGVRELERKFAKICRKVAKEIISEPKKKILVKPENLEHFLGISKYFDKTDTTGEKVGEVNGLAWTAAGGTVLKVEANIMEGKGNLNLTGKLGDVMKESAQAAVSYIRANAKKLNIDPKFFEENDLHLHFPEGAVPKDGPSAGITIVTSLLSAVKEIPVEQNIGMTGEVTIHGDILPIGGLNAKLMAAKRSGIKKVLIPDTNKKDLTEIDDEITDFLEIKMVKHISEVCKEVLGI